MTKILTQQFLKELEAEVVSTRKCLERITEENFNYKPHEKSMLMGHLALLVADIPKWIPAILEKGEINFATWEKYTEIPIKEMVKCFDDNIRDARRALDGAEDQLLQEDFYLKAGEQEILHDSKLNTISSTLNHLVHHRGQLTVYMRLNNIAVPPIYGPSADDKNFK